MHDTGRMGLRQPFRDLDPAGEHLLQRQGSPREVLPQRLPLDELHGDPRHPVRRPDVVDRDDVRMVER